MARSGLRLVVSVVLLLSPLRAQEPVLQSGSRLAVTPFSRYGSAAVRDWSACVRFELLVDGKLRPLADKVRAEYVAGFTPKRGAAQTSHKIETRLVQRKGAKITGGGRVAVY